MAVVAAVFPKAHVTAQQDDALAGAAEGRVYEGGVMDVQLRREIFRGLCSRIHNFVSIERRAPAAWLVVRVLVLLGRVPWGE
jgi:hypothetical protein